VVVVSAPSHLRSYHSIMKIAHEAWLFVRYKINELLRFFKRNWVHQTR